MKKINYKYEIVKRNDGMYAVCEYRWMEHSVNTKQVYVSFTKKDCINYLKGLKK